MSYPNSTCMFHKYLAFLESSKYIFLNLSVTLMGKTTWIPHVNTRSHDLMLNKYDNMGLQNVNM